MEAVKWIFDHNLKKKKKTPKWHENLHLENSGNLSILTSRVQRLKLCIAERKNYLPKGRQIKSHTGSQVMLLVTRLRQFWP